MNKTILDNSCDAVAGLWASSVFAQQQTDNDIAVANIKVQSTAAHNGSNASEDGYLGDKGAQE
jgi:hypothetical protein